MQIMIPNDADDRIIMADKDKMMQMMKMIMAFIDGMIQIVQSSLNDKIMQMMRLIMAFVG